MNRASLLQVRQLGYLLYNHFELKRTERELNSGGSNREDRWELWTKESGSLITPNKKTIPLIRGWVFLKEL